MSERIRAGNSWTAWYASQREANDAPVHVLDDLGYNPGYKARPTRLNCGQVAEAATDPIPDRCEACWAKLVRP